MNQNTTLIGLIVLILGLLPVSMNAWGEYQDRKDVRLAAKAHVNAGQQALKASELPTAEAAFRAALRLSPIMEEAKLGLAMSQAERIVAGNLTAQRNDAIALAYQLQTALRTDPSHAVTFQLALAELHKALGQVEQARSFFEQATSADSATARAWLLRGRFELSQRDGKAAIDALNKAIEKDPKQGAAYLALGEAHQLDKNLEAALSAYQKATEIAASATAWFKLGETQLLLDQTAPAYQSLAKAADLHTSPQTDGLLLKRLGVAAYKVKRFDESVRVLTRAAQLDKSTDTATNLAVAHQALNDHKTAVAILANVIGQDPTHGAANLTLVTSLAYLNRRADAHRVGKKFIAFASANPKLKTAATKVSKILEQLPMTAAERMGARAPATSNSIQAGGGAITPNAQSAIPTPAQNAPAQRMVTADDVPTGPPPSAEPPTAGPGKVLPPPPVIENPVAAEPGAAAPAQRARTRDDMPQVLAPGDPGIPGRPDIPAAEAGRPKAQPTMPSPGN